MNVFYEEEGTLKVGAVLLDNVASLQVEAPHGKRSKIKSANVLLRFEHPGIIDFMPEAQKVAEELDLDFLWQCSSGEEFGYETLAQEYYGRTPNPTEAAGVLMKLHSAPMYFYKRGKGRYKAAPEEALKAALASVERKKQQALKKEAYVAQLTAGELPNDLAPVVKTLLFKPDRNSIEWKALEEASAQLKLSPVRVIERCGGIPSSHDYHLERFLFENFPRGAGFAVEAAPELHADLPLANVAAFSVDDASTTEIDDAFSIDELPNGNLKIGIHIAAPALGITADARLDMVARERLSTVYFPGGKITMLPPAVIDRYTLEAERDCPALSFYTELTPAFESISTETRVERIRMAENLRHDALETLFTGEALEAGAIDHAYAGPLTRLWQWARHLERLRRGDVPELEQRPEYVFRVENDRVQIVRRSRGTPIDKLVSELMIYVNTRWGSALAASETPALYRVQAASKVRMSTVPSKHVGLGVEQYTWSSSPLRRYVDLVNQRQLIALARCEPPVYPKGDERLLAIMREFEAAYEAYGEFQRSMERYWCLRWLLQEGIETVTATVLRENLCRFDELPLVLRVVSLPQIGAGTRVVLQVSDIDLLELTFHCEFKSALGDAPLDSGVQPVDSTADVSAAGG